MQEPAGPAPSGARTPTILPGKEALLAESLQPFDVPQGPPPPLVLGGQPRLPSMDLPPMGEDSPPALGLMPQGLQPPPALPPLQVPEQLPSDPSAASQLLELIPEYLKNQLARSDYQRQLDVATRINEGPQKAEGLRTRMMLEPDAPDIDKEIDASEPYLPKSTTQRLRQSRSRTKVLRAEMDSFDKELEEHLRGEFQRSVVRRGEEKKLRDLTLERDTLSARIKEAAGDEGFAGMGRPEQMLRAAQNQELRQMMERRDSLNQQLRELSPGGVELSDVGRGLGSIASNEGSVQDSMLGSAKKLIDQRVARMSKPTADAFMGQLARGKVLPIDQKMPDGVTPEMYRAALSEQAARTVQRIKGVTTSKDFVSGAVGMAPWMLTGAGEVMAAGKVAQKVVSSLGVLQKAPKVAKAVEVGITYVAGPAVAEAAIAASQPLSPTAQNEVDQIESKDLREATEGAYRVLQVSQAASLSTLFSMSDVVRSFAAGGSLGKMAQRYVEKSTLGKAIGSTLAMAAAAPALTDLSNVGLEEVASLMRSGDVSRSDVLTDMAQAKNPHLFGAARRFLENPSWETVRDYALEAAPMATGIGAVHAMAFAGAKFSSRKQKLEADREIEADVAEMVEKGKLPPEVGEVVVQKMRQETEQMAPTHGEDRRRADQETITSALGKEGGEARVIAEKAADELLPHLPGDTVRKKLAAAVEAHERDPDNPARQRDLEVAMRLEEAAAALDKEEAALAMASARRRASPEPLKTDLADGAMQELLRHEEQAALRPQELDAVGRKLAEEVSREWEIVHRDEESGDFTLRSLGDGERIVVPDNELMHYRIADDAADAPAAPDLPQAPKQRFRDELHETAVAAVQQGATSQRQLAKALGIGQRRAASLFQEMAEDGVVVREGKAWRLAESQPRRTQDGAITLSEARQRDLERLGKEASDLVDQIGTAFLSKGSTLPAEEASDKLGRLIVDWGDIARPDDPEAGSAAIAAQLLRQMPEELQTDETITKTFGMAKEAIPSVRAAMADPGEAAASQAGVGASIRPGGPEMPQIVDTRLAAKQATVDALPEHVRDAWSGAREKVTEKDAAEAAFAEWSRDDLDLAVKTHAEFVKGEQVEVDAILKRLVRGKSRNEALDHLAERIRDLELQSEATALLSLTDDGRKVIRRLNELRDAIFVGGAIPDHLLASLQTGERFQPKPDKESGSVYVPNFLGGGWQMLVSQAKRAWMWLKIGRRGMGALFAKAMHNMAAGAAIGAGAGYLIGGPIGALGGGVIGSGMIPRTFRGLKRLRKDRGAARDLKKLLDWTETVAPDEQGEILGGVDRGAGKASNLVDQLSKWRETDAAFMVERSAHGRLVADQMFAMTNKAFGEDSRADALVSRWLEAPNDEERAKLSKEFAPKQLESLEAFREFWRETRELVARKMLPDQLVREKEYLPHLRVVAKRLEQARAALEQPLLDALAARSKLPRGKRKEKPSAEWRAADARVRQVRRAIKKYDADIAKVGADIAKIHGELDQIARDWGVENYSPHVSNAPHDGPIMLGDPREMLARLHEYEATTLERARDHVWSPVPPRLRSVHWLRRKGTMDPAKRDSSYVRSMFHYVRELYRLAPAINWFEGNRERLFGKQRVLTNDEIDRGSVDRMDNAAEGYRSRRVRWVDFGRGKAVRADVNVRLGGKVYTLRYDKGGETREYHFRTYEDLAAAKEMGATAMGLDDTWKMSEDQVFGARILLLPDKGAEANPDQRIRTVETDLVPEEGVEQDEVTKQLHLPTFAKLHYPSEVYGRLATTEPGKYQRILAESGEKSAKAFAEFVQDVLNDAAGRNILSMAQGVTSVIANIARHKALGFLSPGAAVKEIADTTAMNSVRLGVDNAWEAAAWSMEFSARLQRGMDALDRAGLAKWLKEHKLTEEGSILPPSLVEAVKTPADKLAVMPKDKRERALLQDEAFEAFLGSSLSGGSVMAMFTPPERRYRHGEKVSIDWRKPWAAARGLGRMADKASWFLRGRAQEHTMQQTWLGAYMVARRGGLDKAQAYKQANLYALSASIVANRATLAPITHTAPGQLVRPLMTWVISQSPINYRYLFRASGRDIVAKKAGMFGPPTLGRWARLTAHGTARAVSKFAAMLVNMYIVQQIGQLFGFDVVRSIGHGLSEVPIVGKWGVWKSHELQSQMQLAAAPEDATKTAPAWRQKAMQVAKEHAPEWMREWILRQARLAGSMPADAPIFPMWGNWIPYAAETAQSWVDLFKAEMVEGDVKKASHLWRKNLVGNMWFMRVWDQVYGTEPDPSDPNFVFVRNPATGVTNVRREKGDWARVAYNMFGSSVDDSIDRIEKQVLGPIRTEREQASTRSSAFLAGRLHQEYVQAKKQHEQTSDPGAKAKLEQVAATKRREFSAAAIAYARENEMTPAETRALMNRWRKAAEQNYLLTAAERDIVNAYSSDMAFRLMTNELNKVPLVDKPAMTKRRWSQVLSLWFKDGDAMKQSLRGVEKETRNQFLQALKTAKQRWAMQEEAEKEGIR